MMRINKFSFNSAKYKLDISKRYIPVNISKYFNERCKYILYSTKSIIAVPILEFAYEALVSFTFVKYPYLKKDFENQLESYATGFVDGYESSFTPFIVTPETLKESILIAIQIQKTGFPTSFNDIGTDMEKAYFKESAFVEMGYKYGRNYRAWQILLETPKYFENEELFTQQAKDKNRKINPTKTKFEDILNKNGNTILPRLKTVYYKAKPIEFAFLLKAMYKLNMLQVNPLSFNNVELHRMMKAEFGPIGSRQSLSSNIKRDDIYSKEQIKLLTKRLKDICKEQIDLLHFSGI